MTDNRRVSQQRLSSRYDEIKKKKAFTNTGENQVFHILCISEGEETEVGQVQ